MERYWLAYPAAVIAWPPGARCSASPAGTGFSPTPWGWPPAWVWDI